MEITSSLLCLIAGFILLAVIYHITSWELTVVVMFFWLCYKIEIVVENQKIITNNQKTNANNQIEMDKLLKGLY